MRPHSEASPPRVLVADDQPDVLEALRHLLVDEGFEAVTVGTPTRLLQTLEHSDVDIVLMDLNYARNTTSGREGFDLLERLRTIAPELPVIVMTAWGTVTSAVEAMRRGARDYIEKPWDNDRLVSILRTQVELGRALRQGRLLRDHNRRLQTRELPHLVATSKAMTGVLKMMERVAPSDANVLVTGEHGTGKEVVARWIHAASARAERPLVVVNAGSLPEGVFESELFGHVRGAFTDAKTDRVGCFELADGGTLFLDEIGNMPLSQQAKLLRVVQTGELQPVGSAKLRHVDVRIVSATNAALEADVPAGRFREDLLYRLNTVEIRLPPLRDRPQDIPALAEHFLASKAASHRRSGVAFSAEAMQAMLRHEWPGNVRELAHTVERALLMSEGASIEVEDLGLRRPSDGAQRADLGPEFDDLTLDEAERILIERALARTHGDVRKAAQRLGLSRSALYRRLQRHGLGGGAEP